MRTELTINIGLVKSPFPENQQLVQQCSRRQVIFIGQRSTEQESVDDAKDGEMNGGGRIKMATDADRI
jgi:hypothetical protein